MDRSCTDLQIVFRETFLFDFHPQKVARSKLGIGYFGELAHQSQLGADRVVGVSK